MSSFQSLEEHISILSSFRSRGANGIEAGNGSQESESYVAIPLASSGSGGNSACQYSGGGGGTNKTNDQVAGFAYQPCCAI